MGIPGRNERRKAATRQKIIRAANALFQEKGYVATSMEDISRDADVAIRTIYLHFESKAAVLLAFFDAWMDDFVELVAQRTADEPVDVAVQRALAGMVDRGWDDAGAIDEIEVVPPMLGFLRSGSPEIAGHVMQRWVAALDELTARFRELSGAGSDSLRERIEATAVFAAWMVTSVDFPEQHPERLARGSAQEVGSLALTTYLAGLASYVPPAGRG